MAILNIPPVCKVPGCKQGSQVLSKQGDTTRFMTTCRIHWNDLIPKKEK